MFWNDLFVVLSLQFPRLLIDNKQARRFSFEFRPFDLSPRKKKKNTEWFIFV